ncbi:dihydrofolate reductase family protein [Streptosporangium sp. NPDC004379]|uniref:dihydrofolate reductase family protein n=1 Tax=Streptosporangium sp. NPDC004379 TaxID=3366189 RepID=UPI00368BFBC0
MRKVIASVYTTLDGFIDDPHLWSLKYWTDEAAAYSHDQLFASDALLMGRVTYEGFALAWPGRTGEFADRMNDMPKYVVSSTLDKADEWHNTSVIPGGEVTETVAELKRRPGRQMLIYGCGRLTDTLMEHGLLDEYRIWVHPRILGRGRRLFREGTDARLRLLDTLRFDSGVVVLSYAPQDPSPTT